MTNLCTRQTDYTINEALCGQRYNAMFDPLRAMTMRPDLRKSAIMCYKDSSIEGLFAQIQSLLGNDKRTTTTREFYTQELCQEGGMSIVVLTHAAGAAGADVTVDLDPASHSLNGTLSLPQAGYMVYQNGTPGKKYKIQSVNKTVNGVHTVTLRPLNGGIVDLSAKAKYTLVVSRMKQMAVCSDDCLTGNNFVLSPPTLRKHYVQKYYQVYDVKEDELNNYAYTEHAYEVDFTDVYGNQQKQWGESTYTTRLMKDIKTNRIMETLFGIRDDVNELGFDGMITTAEKNSYLNMVYDPAQGATFAQIFLNLVRRIRKTRGCSEYLLCHDFEFGLDWDAGLTELAKGFQGTQYYSLIGQGGVGKRDLIWPEFGFFKYMNYKFGRYLVDMFDDPKFGGNLREHFAFLLPMCKFTDTDGKSVPPVTYATMKGAETGPDMQIYVVDKRYTMNCPIISFTAKDLFGLEIHCASHLGLLYKQTC